MLWSEMSAKTVFVLELSVFRGTREWYYVTNIAHARDEQQQSFETEPESAMRSGSPSSGVEVPPYILFRNADLFDTLT